MTPTLYFENLVCPACGQSLQGAAIIDGCILCPHCGTRWPLIAGRFPVLMKDAWPHLHATSNSITRHLQELQQQQQHWHQQCLQYPQRAGVFTQAANALAHNTRLLQSLHNELLPLTNPEQLRMATTAPASANYDFTIEYYWEKDWLLAPGEAQRWEQLMAPVWEALAVAGTSFDAAVLPGAGMGRFAWEMSRRCTQVTAIDNSIVLAACFGRILQGGASYYRIGFTNRLQHTDIVRCLPAGLPAGEAPAGHINYCIADATALPLATASQQLVASVYFSDVLPLHDWLPEAERVLQPGGWFLHYGPLAYHFTNTAWHYAADEWQAIAAARGFETIVSRICPPPENQPHQSLLGTQYHNWLWLCRYQPANALLGTHNRIRLHPQLQYQLTQGFGTDDEPQVLLKLGQTTMLASDALLELLQGIGTTEHIGDLLAAFGETYELDAAAHAQLLQSLNQLYLRHMIQKIE